MNKATDKKVIVYADDDPDDLELVKDAFLNYSDRIDVLTFKNGAQALSYLTNLDPSEKQPCLIILDINMPIVTGKEVLQQLRQNSIYDTVPVVLFTTSSNPVDKSFALQYKAGLVNKPIQTEQMAYIADQFIDHCSEATQKMFRG